MREQNEDFAFAGEVLIAVADGVGGNPFGEVASELAIASISYLDDRIFAKAPATEMEEATQYANLRIQDAVGRDATLRGMATTLTALRLDGEIVMVAQIGDSRAYRLRAGRLERLTRDDSLVEELLEARLITPDEARTHPARSVVLQALDGGSARPTISSRDVALGDRFLVCSDGLTDVVDDTTLAGIVHRERDRDACCAALIDAALAAGGPDNITCVIADVGRYVAASLPTAG